MFLCDIHEIVDETKRLRPEKMFRIERKGTCKELLQVQELYEPCTPQFARGRALQMKVAQRMILGQLTLHTGGVAVQIGTWRVLSRLSAAMSSKLLRLLQVREERMSLR